MAFALKKSLTEILSLPEWEIVLWKSVFDLYGPLDWQRNDLLIARINQFQAAEPSPLRDFVLFEDPKDRKSGKNTEDDILKAFGYRGE